MQSQTRDPIGLGKMRCSVDFAAFVVERGIAAAAVDDFDTVVVAADAAVGSSSCRFESMGPGPLVPVLYWLRGRGHCSWAYYDCLVNHNCLYLYSKPVVD